MLSALFSPPSWEDPWATPDLWLWPLASVTFKQEPTNLSPHWNAVPQVNILLCLLCKVPWMPILLSDCIVAGRGEGGRARRTCVGTVVQSLGRRGWPEEVTNLLPRALCKDSAHPLGVSFESSGFTGLQKGLNKWRAFFFRSVWPDSGERREGRGRTGLPGGCAQGELTLHCSRSILQPQPQLLLLGSLRGFAIKVMQSIV